MLSPGITGKPWYERSEFQWVPELEANVDVIKSEYMALQRDNSDYDLVEGEHTLHEGDWKWSAGKFLEILIIHVELAIRCMPAKLYTLHWHAERQHTHTRKVFKIHSPINIIYVLISLPIHNNCRCFHCRTVVAQVNKIEHHEWW